MHQASSINSNKKTTVINDLLYSLNRIKAMERSEILDHFSYYSTHDKWEAYNCLNEVVGQEGNKIPLSQMNTNQLTDDMLLNQILSFLHNMPQCDIYPRRGGTVTGEGTMPNSSDLQNCGHCGKCCCEESRSDMKKVLAIMQKTQEDFQKIKTELYLHVSFLNNVGNIDRNVYAQAAKMTYAQASSVANGSTADKFKNSDLSSSLTANSSSDMQINLSESSIAFLGSFFDPELKEKTNNVIQRCNTISSNFNNACQIIDPLTSSGSSAHKKSRKRCYNTQVQNNNGCSTNAQENTTSKGSSPPALTGGGGSHSNTTTHPLLQRFGFSAPPTQVVPYQHHHHSQFPGCSPHNNHLQGFGLLGSKSSKAHQCGLCKASFTTKFSLDRHQRLHSGEKPFICNKCNRNFRQKSHLIKHQRSVCNSSVV